MSTPLFPDHAQREALQAEAHARPPLSIVHADAEVWHWVVTDIDPSAEWAGKVDSLTRHRVMEVEDGLVRVERHTEFISITFLGTAAPIATTGALLQECKGKLLTGQRIVIRGADASEMAKTLFRDHRQFGGCLLDPKVRIRSDFIPGSDSMVDYLVEGAFVDADQRGQTVKWLIDLETYRVASLLALPLVRELDPRLHALDAKAAEIIQSLSSEPEDKGAAYVDDLAKLLSETSEMRESVRFRISASAAYYQLVQDRLAILQQTPEQGRLTLEGFIEHRLAPAIKTVFAFERRLNDLSQMVSSAMDLARTRIEHRVQLQNQQLLASMERRAHQQVHLAQAVEGLSVAAITYYIISLISKELENFPYIFGISNKVIIAVLIPVIALGVWFAAHRARKAIEKI